MFWKADSFQYRLDMWNIAKLTNAEDMIYRANPYQKLIHKAWPSVYAQSSEYREEQEKKKKKKNRPQFYGYKYY